MKEFMTTVSEYAGENEGESKRNSNMMIIYVMGAVVLVVCILCLLMLWRKIADRNKAVLKSETYTETADTIMADAPKEEFFELQKTAVEDTNEITISEYAQEEEIRKQYLADMEYLREKVESLLQSMSKTKETLEEVVKEQEGNVLLKEQVSEITSEISRLTTQLQTTQGRISELKESITVMNNETILEIRENISEIEAQIDTVDIDISDIYTKIDSLKTMDAELQKKIEQLEKNLTASAEQNMTDVSNQFDNVNDKMQQMEGDTQTKVENLQTQISGIQNSIQQLESQILRYNYEAESKTLYLYTNQDVN